MEKSTRFTMAFVLICLVMFFGGAVTVGAESFDTCSVAYIQSVSEIEGHPAGYTARVTASENDKKGVTDYFQFALDSDSWVRLSGYYSLYSHDGAGTHVDIYSDSGLSNRIGGFGWGYWQYDKEFTGFLTKGTYYAVLTTKQENYRQDFDGNVNVTAAAIPVSDIFGFHVKTAASRKTAIVSIEDALGSYAKSVQYRKGNVSPTHVNDSTFWKKRTTSGPDDAVILSVDNGRYSFKVTENSFYTVMVEDTNGSRYSSAVKVSGIDDKRPVVVGVKNGRTYKKAVTVRFSDRQSGIKSAKLNGRKISSGTKVSADGTYRLVVADQAGNKTIVQFRIRK